MRQARRVGLLLCSLFLILVGALLTPTPLPVGAIMIGIGLGMLLANSKRAKILAVRLMRRYPYLREWRTYLRKLPNRYRGKAKPSGQHQNGQHRNGQHRRAANHNNPPPDDTPIDSGSSEHLRH